MKSEIQRRTFTNFATSTTLHGWRYFTDRPLHWFDCVFWVLVLAAVYIIGIQFVVSNTRQYLDATIQTTIESTTTPLSEVYFPAVTLCNINQVCFKRLQIDFNSSNEKARYEQFIVWRLD